MLIDEVEKFSHPELISKIANMIFEISKSINIVVTTHSQFFLETIFIKHKRELEKNNKAINITYLFKRSLENDAESGKLELEKLESEKIKDTLLELNIRGIKNIAKLLFSSNIFLLEGLNDECIISDLISSNDNLSDVYYSIIDCECKNNIKKIYSVMDDLNILENFNIFIMYDLDNDKKELEIDKDKVNKIIKNDKDLESEFFEIKIEEKKEKIIIKSDESTETIRKNEINFNKSWILSKSTIPKKASKRIDYMNDELLDFFKIK